MSNYTVTVYKDIKDIFDIKKEPSSAEVIFDNIIKNIEERLKDKQLKIELTDKCKQYIIENSYDESFGARPIKRYISKNIESLIANNILEDNIKFNSTITIDIKNDNFIIQN